MIAAIAPHALLAWTDHRKLPSWLAALVVVGGRVRVHACTRSSPTRPGTDSRPRATFHQYFHDLGDAPHVLRTAVVPVPAVGSALLLALVALWLAGAIAEWSARRYDASARRDRPEPGAVRRHRCARRHRLGVVDDHVRTRRHAVSRRVAPVGDDGSAELVPHRRETPVQGAAGRHRRRARRGARPRPSSPRCFPARGATRGSTTGRSARVATAGF